MSYNFIQFYVIFSCIYTFVQINDLVSYLLYVMFSKFFGFGIETEIPFNNTSINKNPVEEKSIKLFVLDFLNRYNQFNFDDIYNPYDNTYTECEAFERNLQNWNELKFALKVEENEKPIAPTLSEKDYFSYYLWLYSFLVLLSFIFLSYIIKLSKKIKPLTK